jgi:RimJ/RimL family protein N-acetyltransferase
MISDVTLRNVILDDLPTFYKQQLDPDAIAMAAFTAEDPTNAERFHLHWERILADPTVRIKTIVVDAQVVGYVSSYVEGDLPEVTYWLGKPYWGKGYATAALTAFLTTVQLTRPIAARVAKDNQASLRVLTKAGFTIVGEDRGFANGRRAEVEEFLLRLE